LREGTCILWWFLDFLLVKIYQFLEQNGEFEEYIYSNDIRIPGSQPPLTKHVYSSFWMMIKPLPPTFFKKIMAKDFQGIMTPEIEFSKPLCSNDGGDHQSTY